MKDMSCNFGQHRGDVKAPDGWATLSRSSAGVDSRKTGRSMSVCACSGGTVGMRNFNMLM